MPPRISRDSDNRDSDAGSVSRLSALLSPPPQPDAFLRRLRRIGGGGGGGWSGRAWRRVSGPRAPGFPSGNDSDMAPGRGGYHVVCSDVDESDIVAYR